MTESETEPLGCRLTTPELQRRKTTVLASLRDKIQSRKETPNGYQFEFASTDAILGELIEFVKTERACCPFFEFNVRVGREGEPIWLELSGPEGTKQFIRDELGFLNTDATIL